MKYLNAFSIEENDHFEIISVYQTSGFITRNIIFKVVKRLKKHNQGQDGCFSFFSSREFLIIAEI